MPVPESAGSDDKKRPPKPKAQNPVEKAISSWLLSLPAPAQAAEPWECQKLLGRAPKRWTVYEPMVLLPAGSFSSPEWERIIVTAGDEASQRLWSSMLGEITEKGGTKETLTHLAVNEGIPLHFQDDDDNQNILRSPSGLRMLYGDFGPASCAGNPTDEDFRSAFWVSTRQNGIIQTWAPRWTMFSRGNIKEKTRLLDFHAQPPSALQHRAREAREARGKIAVDLYAGIGYFVFSYVGLGFRVLCWELNPWSVEGLQRGALANGWTVRVVSGADLQQLAMEDIATMGQEQIIVFLEDNREAYRRIRELREVDKGALDIMHVNGGLLPTSEDIWDAAWKMATEDDGGDCCWLHLHENVGVADIASRRSEIQRRFDDLQAQIGALEPPKTTSVVEHVELVKTFAPGVWHCVFDVYICRRPSMDNS